MTTPKKTGAGSRRRTAGLVLLALAVVAAVIGLVLALSREQRTPADEAAAPNQTPGFASPSPSVIPFPPVATTPVEVPEAPPAGPEDSSDAGLADDNDPGYEDLGDNGAGDNVLGDKGLSRGQVRVYNNSTIRGLAARVADDLSAAGWLVIEVGNYARGTIPTTTVYYQDSGDQRADAEAIAAEFGMRVEPRFPGISSADPGIVVIVTNDYAR